MTNKELIEKLQEMPLDAEVIVSHGDSFTGRTEETEAYPELSYDNKTIMFYV